MAECMCSLGADECAGDYGVFHPLQDGGMCSTEPCRRPANSCTLPPTGWYCTRTPDHDGPCAAYPE